MPHFSSQILQTSISRWRMTNSLNCNRKIHNCGSLLKSNRLLSLTSRATSMPWPKKMNITRLSLPNTKPHRPSPHKMSLLQPLRLLRTLKKLLTDFPIFQLKMLSTRTSRPPTLDLFRMYLNHHLPVLIQSLVVAPLQTRNCRQRPSPLFRLETGEAQVPTQRPPLIFKSSLLQVHFQ